MRDEQAKMLITRWKKGAAGHVGAAQIFERRLAVPGYKGAEQTKEQKDALITEIKMSRFQALVFEQCVAELEEALRAGDEFTSEGLEKCTEKLGEEYRRVFQMGRASLSTKSPYAARQEG